MQAQGILNPLILIHNQLEQRIIGNPVLHMGFNQIQKIRHLMVFMRLLAAGTGDNELAGRITFYDMFYFAELIRIGNRRAAELRHIDHASASAANNSGSSVFLTGEEIGLIRSDIESAFMQGIIDRT